MHYQKDTKLHTSQQDTAPSSSPFCWAACARAPDCGSGQGLGKVSAFPHQAPRAGVPTVGAAEPAHLLLRVSEAANAASDLQEKASPRDGETAARAKETRCTCLPPPRRERELRFARQHSRPAVTPGTLRPRLTALLKAVSTELDTKAELFELQKQCPFHSRKPSEPRGRWRSGRVGDAPRAQGWWGAVPKALPRCSVGLSLRRRPRGLASCFLVPSLAIVSVLSPN